MAEEGPLSASDIFWQINGGDGGSKLTGAQAASTELGRELAACADQVLALSKEIGEGWQGEAGNEAANAAMPLAMASTVDSMHLRAAEGAVTDQLTAFGVARNAIVPVGDDPPPMEPVDIFTPNAYEQKVAEHEARAQANIRAFTAYHQASTANGETMPASYATLTDPGAPISLVDAGAARETATAAGKDSTTVVAPGTSSTYSPTSRPSSTSTPAGTAGTHQATPGRNVPDVPAAAATPSPGTGSSTDRPTTGQTPDDGTQAAAYTPQPLPSAPVQSAPYEFGPTGSPINHLNTGNGPWAPPNPYTGVGYRTGAPGTGAANPGTGSTPGTGSGARPGQGGGVWRGSGAAPGTGQSPAAPGRGTGAALPGEQVSRGATSAGSAGARGATGAPVGAMGGGRGKEDDKDRKAAPYLRNPDPDDTFAGPHERVAPPVFGERKEG